MIPTLWTRPATWTLLCVWVASVGLFHSGCLVGGDFSGSESTRIVTDARADIADGGDIGDGVVEPDGEPDPNGSRLQECRSGGIETTWDGRPAQELDECGCGGVLVCNDAGELDCLGATPVDACGGCSGLGVELDSECGQCGGSWACDRDELFCANDQSLNACGGCGEIEPASSDISDTPGDSCAYSEGVVGVVGCAAPAITACFPPDSNVCGGAVALTEAPGAPCGECGGGRVVCSGTDATTCTAVPVNLRRNACGGCGALEAPLDSACGCGGTWECSGTEGDQECVGSRTNACGGCTELTETIGGICGPGNSWQCNGTDDVACRESEAACTFEGESRNPGEACGECGDAYIVCIGPVGRCAGGTSINACGGCSALVATPGVSCGPQATWACAGTTLECTINPCFNGVRDGDESDVNCGGSSCAACGLGALCRTGSDCQTGRCNRGQCASPDRDGDTISDAGDNCPLAFNPTQRDLDQDGLGDACDPDRDGDRVPDTADNCPDVANPSQADADRDGAGDSCE